ncbi:MAG TPA: hypothetical protein DIT99_09680, partial [Candidatus Latescibacteria bacterium]|nr:hypothetical protein [Candidatus Latescibacterota bacterium]
MGDIQIEQVYRLRGIGEWLQTNGEAIYGAKPLPNAKQDWGYVVHTPDTGAIYLHILDWPGGEISVKIPDV